MQSKALLAGSTARVSSAPAAPDPEELVQRLVKFRMWEKAQPGSTPVRTTFWPWFAEKLRTDPRERAQTLARLRLHEFHLETLKLIRSTQAKAPEALVAPPRGSAFDVTAGREALDRERERKTRGHDVS